MGLNKNFYTTKGTITKLWCFCVFKSPYNLLNSTLDLEEPKWYREQMWKEKVQVFIFHLSSLHFLSLFFRRLFRIVSGPQQYWGEDTEVPSTPSSLIISTSHQGSFVTIDASPSTSPNHPVHSWHYGLLGVAHSQGLEKCKVTFLIIVASLRDHSSEHPLGLAYSFLPQL